MIIFNQLKELKSKKLKLYKKLVSKKYLQIQIDIKK